MRREHRRPRIVGSVRLGVSSFVDSELYYVDWRSAFVGFWFLSVLGGSWQCKTMAQTDVLHLVKNLKNHKRDQNPSKIRRNGAQEHSERVL